MRISLFELHERVGKSVMSIGKKAKKGYHMHFMGVIYSYCKDSELQQFKGVPFVNRRLIRKGTFSVKNCI